MHVVSTETQQRKNNNWGTVVWVYKILHQLLWLIHFLGYVYTLSLTCSFFIFTIFYLKGALSADPEPMAEFDRTYFWSCDQMEEYKEVWKEKTFVVFQFTHVKPPSISVQHTIGHLPIWG